MEEMKTRKTACSILRRFRKKKNEQFANRLAEKLKAELRASDDKAPAIEQRSQSNEQL